MFFVCCLPGHRANSSLWETDFPFFHHVPISSILVRKETLYLLPLLSTEIVYGLSMCRCCVFAHRLYDFTCASFLLYLKAAVSLSYLLPLPPKIFRPPLWYGSLSLGSRCWRTLSHLGLSAPNLLTPCTLSF